MSDHKWLYVTNPGHDFTREDQGKLSFIDTMQLILAMGKGTISDELIDFFNMDLHLFRGATKSLSPRLSISSLNLLPLFHRQQIDLMITAFLPLMVATSFT